MSLIQHFFPVNDAQNVTDHNFPVPGYLLIPSGYMRLVKKPSPTANAMYLEGEDMTEYRDDGLNDTCTMCEVWSFPVASCLYGLYIGSAFGVFCIGDRLIA